MASEVKTNKISPATGTDVTLGDASDTFTIPASATLDVNGIIDLTGATKTGFPAGGLTAASQWRLTADFTGSVAPIASNLEEVDAPVGFGVLGSSMTESSGIFTFPSTGYWLITFAGNWYTTNAPPGMRVHIYTTTDNSTYALASEGVAHLLTLTGYASANCSYIIDVVSTSLCKCRFDIVIDAYPTDVTTRGNTGVNETDMTFLRLADT